MNVSRKFKRVFGMMVVSVFMLSSVAVAVEPTRLPVTKNALKSEITLPDFKVEEVSINGKTSNVKLPIDATASFSCSVKNAGKATAQKTKVIFEINGQAHDSWPDVVITDKSETFSIPKKKVSSFNSSSNFKCTIDPEHLITELNETNNSKELSFTLVPKYITKSCLLEAAPNPESKKGYFKASNVSGKGDSFVCKYDWPSVAGPGGFPHGAADLYYSYETPCKGAVADKQYTSKYSCIQ